MTPEEPSGRRTRNLRVLSDWLRASRRLKLFPTRWKWRRTRMYQIMTFIIVVVLISASPIFCSVLNNSKANHINAHRQRLKIILDDLTSEETRQIFGSSKPPNELVPRLDIIKPKVYFSKRRKRSALSQSESTEIRLKGLGRVFTLTLKPNPSLLNLNDFVHLFRHENYSEILSDQIVKKQLHCFHHGTVSHQLLSRRKRPKRRRHVSEKADVKTGHLALDTCDNGLKGFIVPVGNDPEHHHYVIHPIPKRFRTSPVVNDKLHATTWTRDVLPEHFIWKRQSLPTSANKHFHYSKHRYSSRPSSPSSSFCAHEDSGDSHKPKLMTSLHLSPRIKRSQINFEDDGFLEQPLLYKPRNVATDSYWLYHRSTAPPRHDDYTRSSHSYTGHGYESHRSMDINQGRRVHFAHQQPSSEYWTPSSGTQSKYIPSRNDDLSRSATSYTNQFPFYTSTSQGQFSDSSNGWMSQDEQYYYNNSDAANLPTSSGQTPSPASTNFYRSQSSADRNGRDDNTIFEEPRPRHSSLDSDIMATAQSKLTHTKVFKDLEPAHLTIETAVFVDKDLYEHMQANFPEDTQSEVSRIVLAMINAVQLLYQDPSLGHRVEFVLKRLEILATDPPGLLRPYDIDLYLTNFCKWQKTENPSSDADPLHWDHALILTGLDLYVLHQSGKRSNQVVGLAPVSGMCTRSSSCTVNEGRHFESVYVMAHEIGHNLGMRHDGPQADNPCDPTAHIMSPTLGSGKITWSPCSKRYLDMFLETSQSKCLLDKAKSETRLDHDADGRLPGERFNADQQCVLKYGRGSFHATQQPIEDVCRDLHCRKQYYTWTSHPALEGTQCGLEMSCRAGKCMSKSQITQNANSHSLGGPLMDAGDHLSNHLGGMEGSETAAYSTLTALNGAWGKWSPFTDCSSACLYSVEGGVSESSTGIRLAARRCDSPRPENGGRQCSGLDRRYKTCTTEKICPTTLPRTSTVQYANEVCTRAAAVDAELNGRGFMSTNTNDPERSCSVWCEIAQGMGSRSRGWSFPDGTACKLSSTPNSSNFCIAGKCQEFTCDGNSHFLLSDDLCEVPSKSGLGFTNRGNGHSSSSDGAYRQQKAFWTKWETQSNCKLTCLAPSKGIQLVQRKCNAAERDNGDVGSTGTACTGLSLSVRLCKPDKSTILSSACTRFQTVFEHATKLCTKYSEKVAGLSGIGMQLSPTKDDSHRPCRIGCQDAALPYRFYMVNGEEGSFPAGTDCSRGAANKKAYCLSGKCVDFGPDDTPTYRINAKVLGRLESILRTKREIHDIMDQEGLQELVNEYAAGESAAESWNSQANISNESAELDFASPVLVSPNDEHFDLIKTANSHMRETEHAVVDIEGGFYEWRKILSDCSASCGRGVQEVVVQCVSGGTVVHDSFCSAPEKPGTSAYIYCQLRPCTKLDLDHERSHNSLWTWIQSMILHHNNYAT